MVSPSLAATAYSLPPCISFFGLLKSWKISPAIRMDIGQLSDSTNYKYKWRSPYDFNNTFALPHIYALVYNGEIKYIGKSTGSKSNYYTGGVIPNKLKYIGIKGVLEFTNKDTLDEREIYWIEKYKPKFNIAAGGRGGLTGQRNPSKRAAVRQKISAACKGKRLTEEHKQKLREAKLKNPVKAHLNTQRPQETRDKIKQAWGLRNEDKYIKIKDLIRKGYYVKEIVAILGVSSATIAKVKKQMNLKSVHNRPRNTQPIK